MKKPHSSSATITQPGALEARSDPALADMATGRHSVVSLSDASSSVLPEHRESLAALAQSKHRGAFYRLWMLLNCERNTRCPGYTERICVGIHLNNSDCGFKNRYELQVTGNQTR